MVSDLTNLTPHSSRPAGVDPARPHPGPDRAAGGGHHHGGVQAVGHPSPVAAARVEADCQPPLGRGPPAPPRALHPQGRLQVLLRPHGQHHPTHQEVVLLNT